MKSPIALHNYLILSHRLNQISRYVSDWDETITAQDTIPLLFRWVPDDSPYKLSYFYKIYMDSYQDYITRQLPSKPYRARDSIANEIAYQKDMKAVELSSFEACIRLDIFRGLTKQQLESLYTDVCVKPGFPEFYSKLICRKELQFGILSVNWSSLFIKKYFKETFGSEVLVSANELSFDSNICTGKSAVDSVNSIRTGYDKLVQIKLKNDHLGRGKFVYIGDSSTDVLALIYSDLGIIMKGGSAAKQLRQMGFRVADINSDVLDNDADSIKFVQIDDWFDILYMMEPKFLNQ
ncbi:hypothetical protein FOA43_000137 [Brettanomyces nanus]|uniref:Haloacid dehalogenase-like hydrolase n=1 Tax=Eeniella nana TaxID=13502 RepID=A0A875RXT9_EENNA|nr:uncharacterized protein FOA43_000137 [Brettanomyces nanus]QPG72835.1 hypothetical protein FOA43_000137 [Brettanomyces nanus]